MRKHHVRPKTPEPTIETISAMIKRTKAKIQSSRYANKYSILGVTLLFAGIGGYFIINSFAITPGEKANIWVSASGTSSGCVRSTSAIDYDASKDCSFDGANDICQGGDTVLIRGGSYGNIKMTGFNSRTAMCTFTVAGDEPQVVIDNWNNGTIGDNETNASWITVRGASGVICRYQSGPCSIKARSFDNDGTGNVVYEGWDVDAEGGPTKPNTTQPFHIEGGGPITVRNTRIHNGWNSNALVMLSGSGPLTFEDFDMYDSLNNTSGVIHDECIWSWGTSNVTMRRGHIWSCTAQTIFHTGSETATNWLLENMIIESPLGPNNNALIFRGGSQNPTPSPDGYVIRNSFIQSISMGGSNAPTTEGFTIENSYVRSGFPSCTLANFTSRNNMTTGTPCDAEDSVNHGNNYQATLSEINAGFISPIEFTNRSETVPATPGNWHLNASSPLRDKASTAYSPALDADGFARYFGLAPDIGPFEYGATSGGGGDTTPPDTTITSSAIGSTTSTSANFTFTSNESGSTFECKLDSGSYSSCTSPKAYTGLTTGSHTFTVRATDTSSNTDATPATQIWTITAPTPKPGDTNGDNAVNIVDLSTLLSRWNTNYPQADFNSDGTVGIVDLSILLSNYGT